MFQTLGCISAAVNSAFKSAFPLSTTGTASVLMLGIGSGTDAAEPGDDVLGPTAFVFFPLPLTSPAQQKQLAKHVHPACFAGHLACRVHYHALSVVGLAVHHLSTCMTTCLSA